MASAEHRQTRAMDTLDEQLFTAAEEGDLKAVKRLVRRGADPGYRNGDGCNAMLVACFKSHIPVVEYLFTLPGVRPDDVRCTYDLVRERGSPHR